MQLTSNGGVRVGGGINDNNRLKSITKGKEYIYIYILANYLVISSSRILPGFNIDNEKFTK